MCCSRSGDNAYERHHSTEISAPRPSLVYTPSNNNISSSSNNNNNNNNNRISSRDGYAKVHKPTREAPAPPSQNTQPTAYSVSAGVAILPTRAAPAQPAKPQRLTQPPQPPAKPTQPFRPPQPPPKPKPKPTADSEPPTQLLDPLRLRPIAAARPNSNRPPLPKKPAVSYI